jgi:putative ABC transport system permease protein
VSARRRGWAARRAAFRLARRDALRARGRSALVVAMVGIPVLLVVTLATLVRTNDVNRVEALPSQLGQAQARINPGRVPVIQDPYAVSYNSEADSDATGTGSPWTPAELHTVTGGTLLERRDGSAHVRFHGHTRTAAVIEADVTNPTARGLLRVTRGQAPHGADEVLVAPRLGRPGDTVTVAGRRRTVVGNAVTPTMGPDVALVVALPGAVLSTEQASTSYLLQRTAPVTWREVRAWNRLGLLVLSREVVHHPPSAAEIDPRVPRHPGSNAALRAVLVIIVASVVLEVVLLAGPAFAVGVRRQQRQVALLLAVGGDRRDVRRTVLAQALVLGGASSAVAALLGVAAARVAVPILEAHTTARFGPFDVAVLDVGVAVLLGAVAALAAAWFPARAAARTDVVTVLAGRRGQVRTRRSLPLLGLALATLAVFVTFSRGMRPGGEFYVAGGTILLVVAALLGLPSVVGLVGRLGARLPLPLRLAARDAARNRSRTVPAVAAVMGVVAGITALAIGGASDFEQSRREYVPRYRMGTVEVSGAEDDLARLPATIQRALPGRTAAVVGQVGGEYRPGTGAPPVDFYVAPRGCPPVPPPGDARCTDWYGDPHQTSVVVGSPTLVADLPGLVALGIHLDAAQRKVLADGGVLVGARRLLRPSGTATLTLYHSTDDKPVVVATRTVRATYLPPTRSRNMTNVIGAVLTPATAERLHLPWYPDRVVVAPGGPLSSADRSRLTAAVHDVAPDATVYVERGFQESFTLPLALLAVVGALAVLVGTATATGLALTDARPDLTTLTAVGARPRTRRALAGGQALVIGLLGTLSGVAVGFLPGLAVTWPLTSTGSVGPGGPHGPVIAVPWLLLGLVAVGVPLLAAAGAGALTRSAGTLSRRTAG